MILHSIRLIFLYFCIIYSYNAYAQRNPMWAVPVSAHYVSNLYQVDSGLYRCAQPNKRAFSELSETGISTVVNLRYFETDKRKSQKTDLQLHHIKMRASKCNDGEVLEVLRLLKKSAGSGGNSLQTRGRPYRFGNSVVPHRFSGLG